MSFNLKIENFNHAQFIHRSWSGSLAATMHYQHLMWSWSFVFLVQSIQIQLVIKFYAVMNNYCTEYKLKHISCQHKFDHAKKCRNCRAWSLLSYVPPNIYAKNMHMMLTALEAGPVIGSRALDSDCAIRNSRRNGQIDALLVHLKNNRLNFLESFAI